MPKRRTLKRLKNRLAKKGLVFERVEQADRDLVTYRLIMQTKREGIGRAFAYPIAWLKTAPGRVIADVVLSDYVRRYGMAPL